MKRTVVIAAAILALISGAPQASQARVPEKYDKFDFLSGIELSREPHSMRDPARYAAERLPLGLLEKIRKGTVSKIIVFEGEIKGCREYFEGSIPGLVEKADAYADGTRTSHLIDPSGRTVVDFRNYGRDLAIQKALIYHYAGVPMKNIDIRLRRNFEYYNRAFFESVKKAGRFDDAIIGYRRSLVRDVTLRKIAALKVELLVKYFSDAARREKFASAVKSAWTLKNRFDPAGYDLVRRRLDSFVSVVTRRGPGAFFRYHDHYRYLRQIEIFLARMDGPENRLYSINEIFAGGEFKNSAGAPSSKIRAGAWFDAPFDMRRFEFTTRDGAKRTILCTRHPYGDLSLSLARLLRAGEAKNIMFIGSCGALSGGLAAGDIVVPEKFIRFSEYFTIDGASGVNALHRRLAENARTTSGNRGVPNKSTVLPGGAKLSKLHCSVPSALIETAGAVDAMRKAGASTVDVESYHIFKKPYMVGPAAAAFIVTDIPGTAKTLENYDADSPLLLDSQMRLLDLVFHYFDIADVKIDAK